jgi:putative glutamine amidotransferase
MTRRPLIAITTAEIVSAPAAAHSPIDRLAVPFTYLQAVSAAGGVPVTCFPHQADAEHLARELDGLILIGGPDVNATLYGQDPHPATASGLLEQDLFELEMLAAFTARERPVLGVCRGLQLMNVWRGGTLHQHLPDLGSRVAHRANETEYAREHGVEFDTGTRIARLVGAATVSSNSFHHQAADHLGAGLRASAKAPDGVIEAVEDPDLPFFVGVQWHPESLQDRAEQRALFDGLIAAA